MLALRRAAEILGSVEALALHLKVSKKRVDDWTHGFLPTPDYIFLKLADLLSRNSLPAGPTDKKDRS